MSDPTSSSPDSGGTWSERNYRTLKIAVIVMSTLLVVGFVLVFVTIGARIADPSTPRGGAAVSTALEADVAALLGPDSEVVSTTVDGSRLALVVRRPEGLAVLVIDLRNGQIVNVVSPR